MLETSFIYSTYTESLGAGACASQQHPEHQSLDIEWVWFEQLLSVLTDLSFGSCECLSSPFVSLCSHGGERHRWDG